MNTESYGSSSHNLLCRNCGKPVTAYLHRNIIIEDIVEARHVDDDYGWRKDTTNGVAR